jgi:hypothetical protein
MVEALNIPARIVTPMHSVFTGVEAFSLLCARFWTVGEMYSLVLQYDWMQSAIFKIINQLVQDLDEWWEHLLDCDREHLLHPHNLTCYADAIHNRGAPTHSVFGFIDCTIRQISRPKFWQH